MFRAPLVYQGKDKAGSPVSEIFTIFLSAADACRSERAEEAALTKLAQILQGQPLSAFHANENKRVKMKSIRSLATRFRMAVVGMAAVACVSVPTAQATVVININEVGSDVVLTISGSLDLTGAIKGSGVAFSAGVIPGGVFWHIGSHAGAGGGLVDSYGLATSAGPFGLNNAVLVPPSSATGDDFLMSGNGFATDLVGVPVGYMSGAAISAQMIFSGTTIAGLTMFPGVYNYTFPNDNIVLNIGQVAEPGALAVLGLGILALGAMRRRAG